jgi:DNA ligase-1
VKLATVVEASARAAATGSRLGKRDAIAACLRAAAPDEIDIAVTYLSGATRQNKLGIGYAAVSALRGESAAAESTLTIADVDGELARIAPTSGKGSASERATRLRAMFNRVTHDEQDFLVRLLIGELRQGALEGVMIDAIAAAAALPVATVRRAAMLAGDLGVVARVALIEGAAGLERYTIDLNRPIQPMLAQSAVDVSEALEQLGTASFEWKVDGARVQVHKDGDAVSVFSRSLKEVTSAVPEVVEIVRALKA